MLVDYTIDLYMPLANLTNKYYVNLDDVAGFEEWKKTVKLEWDNIVITQENNLSDISIDAGNNIEVTCKVKLPNIDINNIKVEVYFGKILNNGVVENINIIEMNLAEANEADREYLYKAKIELVTGGDYGYTFRVMPKHEMLLDSENLDLVKWITK